MAEAAAASCAAAVGQGVLPSARGSPEMSRSGPSLSEASGSLSITPDKLEKCLAPPKCITFFLFLFLFLLLKHHTPATRGKAVLKILSWDCFQLQNAVAIFMLCLGRGLSCKREVS